MTEIALIPEKPEIQETEIPRDYVDLPTNLAENRKLVKKFHDIAYAEFQRYQQQEKRKKMEDDIRDADAMWRVSKRRDRTVQGDDQQQDTLSNVPSTSFHVSHRIINTGQTAMVFNSDANEMPAIYEPLDTTDEALAEHSQRVAKGHNLLFKHTYQNYGYEDVLKKSFFYRNKYGRDLLGMEWDYKTRREIRRVPGYYTKDGKPVEYDKDNPPKAGTVYKRNGEPIDGLPVDFDNGTVSIIDPDTNMPLSYVFVEKEIITANNPCLIRYDVRYSWFDMDEDDPQKWLCLVHQYQQPYGWLVERQATNMFKNVDKLNKNHLFKGETAVADTDIGKDQADNMDVTYESDPNGKFVVFHVWMQAPIDDGSNRRGGNSEKTKGVWDTKKTIPRWFEAYFVGQFGQYDENAEQSRCECVLLRRNPYNHGELPRYMSYSHEDDNGALKLAYSNLVAALYEEDTCTRNNYIDNKTLRTQRPWIGEHGNVLTRNLKFRQGNQVFWVRAGSSSTALTQLQVDDTTGTTLPYLDHLKATINEVMGTDDPIRGAYAGARTTATEARQVLQQAAQPAIEDTRRITNPMFSWILRLHKSNWEQFGDPSDYVTVSFGGNLYRVNPGELYGDLKIKVQAVDVFERDLGNTQALINFTNAKGFEAGLQIMGPDGQREFFIDFAKSLKLARANAYFPGKTSREAEYAAWADVEMILSNPEQALQTYPDPHENHETYIRVLEGQRKLYSAMTPKESQDPLVLQAFDAHIEMHKQLQAQTQQQQQTAMQNQSAQTPGLPGEAAGDVLAGLGGQVA